jgi:hypothetical protein
MKGLEMAVRNIVKIDEEKCNGLKIAFEDITVDLRGNVSRTETIEA